MSRAIELLNWASGVWWTYLYHASWQAALVAVFLLAVTAVVRRWPAPLRYGLLLLALLKFSVPPFWTIPTGVFSNVPPSLAVPTREREAPRGIQSALAKESDAYAPATGSAPVRSPDRVTLDLHAQSATSTTPGKSPTIAHTSKIPRVHWQAWLMLLHLAGVTAVVLWIVFQAVRLGGTRRRASPVTSGAMARQFTELTRELGVRRRPRLMVSGEVQSPVAFGLLRPTVMLPSTVVEKLPLGETRIILGHELAHYQRGDLWVNWLQLTLLAVWWFHPAIWLLNRALRKVREDCCDDMLLARGLTSNDKYCDVLLRTARELSGKWPAGAVLGFAEEAHPLARRLARIMDRTIYRYPKIPAAGLIVLLILGSLILPGLRSQEPGLPPRIPIKVQAGSNPLEGKPRSSGGPTAKPESLDQQFSQLRWVGENNYDFEEMQFRSRQMGMRAIPFLLAKAERKGTEDDDGKKASERRKAIMALGFIGENAQVVVPRLIAALEDDADQEFMPELGMDTAFIRVGAAAADALSQFGGKARTAVPALMESVKFGQPRALVALARIAPEDKTVFQIVSEALNDLGKGRRLPVEGDFRLAALEALGLLAKSNRAALGPIRATLATDEFELPDRAAEILVDLSAGAPEVKALLAGILRQGATNEQLRLALILARNGDRSDVIYAILLRAASSESSESRKAALESIASFRAHARELQPLLAKLVRTESDPQLQAAALRSAAFLGKDQPEVAQLVIECLGSSEVLLRKEALQALPLIGELAKPAADLVIETLQSPNAILRRQAAEALGQIRVAADRAVPSLRRLLQDEHEEVCAAALRSMAQFGEAGRDCLPYLIKRLQQPGAMAAATAIGELGPWAESAVPALIQALNSPDESLRNNAANALGRIGPKAKAAIPALAALRDDRHGHVRRNALWSLWRIDGRKDIVSVLAARLESEEKLDQMERKFIRSARMGDAYWLGQIGPDADSAIPVLERLLKDADDDLREVILKSLSKIRGPGTDAERQRADGQRAPDQSG